MLNLARKNRHRKGEAKSPSPPPTLKPDPLPQVAGEENEMRAPPKPFVPPPPSPLGLSNYDALDDDYPMDGLDEESGNTDYYSDFSVLEADDGDTTTEEHKVQETEPFMLPEPMLKEQKLPSPPDEMLVEMMTMKERKREVMFVELGS